MIHAEVIQQAAKLLVAENFIRRAGLTGITKSRRNRIPNSLMRAVLIVMAFGLLENVIQMILAKQNHIVQPLPDFAD